MKIPIIGARGAGREQTRCPEPIDAKRAVDIPGIGLASAWPTLPPEMRSLHDTPARMHSEEPGETITLKPPAGVTSDSQEQPALLQRTDALGCAAMNTDPFCDSQYLRHVAAGVHDETERMVLMLLADFLDEYELRSASNGQDRQRKQGIA